jgi:energy-coupling factor transporter ATP-binding protein EcfA2
VIDIEGVRYYYPASGSPALDGIDVTIQAGTRGLVTGASGSGKSTLLRAVNGLVPHFYGGRFGGRVVVGGVDTRRASPRSLAGQVGTVFQDSQARFLTGSIEEEVSFSMELARAPAGEVEARVREILDRMGLAALRDRKLDHLSAGERARVAIAAALARRPAVLVLDEPVTHLDPSGAIAVVEWVRQLTQEDGLAALIAEHRYEWWRGQAEQEIGLAGGRLRRGAGVPDGAGASVEGNLPGPVREGLVRAENLSLRYGRTPALAGVSLVLRPGEVVGLVGRNGSGKTTLLRCLAGLTRPDAGTVTLDGDPLVAGRRVAYVPQPPSGMLLSETVRDEVGLGLNGAGTNGSADEVQRWIRAFGLTGLDDRFPRDLSAGERERVAIASVLITRPSVVLLDEPTLGMDRDRMMAVGGLLRSLAGAGASVLIATHDAAFVAEFASRAVLLAAGRIIADGPPPTVLGQDPDFERAWKLWKQAYLPAATPGGSTGEGKLHADH